MTSAQPKSTLSAAEWVERIILHTDLPEDDDEADAELARLFECAPDGVADVDFEVWHDKDLDKGLTTHQSFCLLALHSRFKYKGRTALLEPLNDGPVSTAARAEPKLALSAAEWVERIILHTELPEDDDQADAELARLFEGAPDGVADIDWEAWYNKDSNKELDTYQSYRLVSLYSHFKSDGGYVMHNDIPSAAAAATPSAAEWVERIILHTELPEDDDAADVELARLFEGAPEGVADVDWRAWYKKQLNKELDTHQSYCLLALYSHFNNREERPVLLL
jgi:hypothetical protein